MELRNFYSHLNASINCTHFYYFDFSSIFLNYQNIFIFCHHMKYSVDSFPLEKCVTGSGNEKEASFVSTSTSALPHCI